nr:hypothetical protein [Tanacetum cinerariifolium]
CKIFDHTNDGCPKNPKVAKVSSGTNDGFMEVKKKKNMSKQHRHIEASDQFKVNKVPVSGPKTSVSVTNSFSALAENMENEIEWGIKDKWNKDASVLNESDSEVEELILEDNNGKQTVESNTEGESTPVTVVSHD